MPGAGNQPVWPGSALWGGAAQAQSRQTALGLAWASSAVLPHSIHPGRVWALNALGRGGLGSPQHPSEVCFLFRAAGREPP